MLNTTSNYNKTNFNTPATGIIQKSHKESFFVRFHQNSVMAKEVLELNGSYYNRPIIVLQILLSDESYFIAELIKCEDFQKEER